MAERILVVRFGSLGDVVLTSPTLLNLKLAHPAGRVTVFTKDQFAGLAGRFDGVDEVRTIPARTSATDLYRAALRLDKENFDLIVDLHGNFRSWLTRLVCSASTKVVYPKRRFERRRMVQSKRFPEDPIHTVDAYNSALSSISIPSPCRRPLLPMDAVTRSSDAPPYVVIAPGAAHPNKQWPMERFAEVAVWLAHEHSLQIVWAVTGAEAGKSGLEQKLPGERFRELVDIPILDLAAVLARARLTISNDSGLMHVSSAVGTPVLGIFGPTHPALGFSPRGLFDRIIEVDEACRPCSLHGKKPCYRSERFCFTRISSEMVLAAATEMLAAAEKRAPALFLDRDGTVMVDKDYLSDPAQVQLIPGVADTLARISRRGFKLVVLSNQSGVARGRFDLDAVARVNGHLAELLAQHGVKLDGSYFCPHLEGGTVPAYGVKCRCRKPAPGMAEQAALELGLDLRRSWVIGDKRDDLSLARVIGARRILVRTGYGTETERSLTSHEVSQVKVLNSLAELGSLFQ
jgi:D,D-heptose 1,7-bisphosphate phosphatase